MSDWILDFLYYCLVVTYSILLYFIKVDTFNSV